MEINLIHLNNIFLWVVAVRSRKYIKIIIITINNRHRNIGAPIGSIIKINIRTIICLPVPKITKPWKKGN